MKEEDFDIIIKIDSNCKFGISVGSDILHYEEIEASGSIIKADIKISKIKQIKYIKKEIDTQETGCNLFINFIFTLLDSGSHPSTVKHTIPKLIIKYSDEDTIKHHFVINNNLTRDIYKQLISLTNNN